MRGIARMVDEDVYCIDVLTQVSAVTRALQAVALGLLEEHLGHCVTEAVAGAATRAANRCVRPPRRYPAWSDPDCPRQP